MTSADVMAITKWSISGSEIAILNYRSAACTGPRRSDTIDPERTFTARNNWSQSRSLSRRFQQPYRCDTIRGVVLIPGGTCETPGFPRFDWRRGGVAARGARAAGRGAGDRFVYPGTPELSTGVVAAFRKGLGETGFVEGRNVTVEFRFAYNDNTRVAELLADLVSRRVAVIVTPGSTSTALAAKAATMSIPVVFSVGTDPVEIGLVTSLSRPGGNVTGITSLNSELAAKRLGLMLELHQARCDLPRWSTRTIAIPSR
jgi:ABC transporter substrate binding protein